MLVREVKELVSEWVMNYGTTSPDFMGALFRGSITKMQDDDEFPMSSDVDLGFVFEHAIPDEIPKKTVLNGVSVGGLCWLIDRFKPVDKVLGDYRIGFSFQRANLIPGAKEPLVELTGEASREFPKRYWVNQRVEDAQANCAKYVESVYQAENAFDQVMIWLWATGITCHIVLAAGMKNPTVRKRYLAARNVLSDFEMLDFYEALHRLQGSCDWDRFLTDKHFENATRVFDIACEAGPHPFPFGADICKQSRVSVIGGTKSLIDQGDHREAVYWIVATFARSLRILEHVGDQESLDEFRPSFDEMLSDLGLDSERDIFDRTERVKAAIPQVMDVAHAIMDRHKDIIQ